MTSKIKIDFVTDSTSDILPQRASALGIGVVPCFVNYSGNSYADDGVELVREDYYNQMAHINPPPTTSAPPPGLVQKMVAAKLNEADHVVLVSASKNFSGIYNSMRVGIQDFPQDRVTLIDSDTTAMGLGWQVLIAREVADETGDVAAVVAAIERVRANARVYAALATLDYLQSSGRVGWAAAMGAKILNIKPLIAVGDGRVDSIGRVRTFKRAVSDLLRLTRTNAPLDRLAIQHTNNLDGAAALRDQLADIAPPDTIITNLNPSAGTHTGPGAVGVAFVKQDWKD